jgi:Ca2+-binding RTX toxin-like protein
VGPAAVGNGFTVTPGDLAFILKQIKIGERHSRALAGTQPGVPANPNPTGDPEYCSSLIGPGPDQIPDALTSYGLRTVDGDCNNLVAPDPVAPADPFAPNVPNFNTRPTFGAADQPFPRLTTPIFRPAEPSPPDFFGPGSGTVPSSSYAQKSGNVFDSQPRLISNLIDDQTSTNPAAVAAAGFPVRTQGNPGVVVCTTPPATTVDPVTGLTVPVVCTPEHKTLFIPNVTTDVGLSPPYNSLFTFFGQFFDHGVDQTVKSGGTVFVPLRADDPLITLGPDGVPNTGDEVPVGQRFMVLTRAQNLPGPDGILGTADDIQDAHNTDTPWVDQSQTYTSHPAHQVFLREYVNNSLGKPVSTGKLLGGLPAGQTYIGSPDGTTGIGTWAAVKKQSRDLLGIQLVDRDVLNVPMLATDPYGKFIPGPLRGLPQFVTTGHGLVEANKADNAGLGTLVPADVEHMDTPFLTDIAHNADPSPDPQTGIFPTPDADNTPSADFAHQPVGTYDNEMLDAHFICGDGRCNENIALSTIHQVFHSEHDRLVDYIKNVLSTDSSPSGVAALAEWKPGTTSVNPDGWNGERLFQAARFVTEMEYQHLVFEEFARKVQPAVRPFHVYVPDVSPAIEAEFAHAVYRFGHSMLDDTVARTNVNQVTGAKTDNSVPLLTAFLNPPEYFNGGTAGVLTPEQAAGSVIMGSSDQVGNELDEFVTETLRNNLLGLPLDLPTLNLTRAREAGVPPLNDFRRQIFAQTNDGQLAPYTSWSDYGQHLKHPESLINFVAAYGTHPTIRDSGPDGILGNADDVTTIAAKRAAARAIVDPIPSSPAIPATATAPAVPAVVGDVPPADAADFMFSTGAWASDATTGKTTTGLDTVDLWVGGLAEVTNLNGGLLGSTFNYVFQNQLEKLQEGDRLYYLARTPGLNLRAQLEGNSFSELIERNTIGTSTLKADAFATADCKFELGNLTFPAAAGSFITGPGSVNDDPTSTDCNENRLLLRKPDGTIQYRAINSVDPSGINGQSVYNGTPGVDRMFGGNDNDTFWGGLGNDVIEGGGGDDVILGGDGNDIITDLDGADVLKGGPGNDALDAGTGNDIVLGGDGQDFMNGGANDNESFAGPGNDFIIAGQGADTVFGDGGDDWIQGGTGQDLLQGDHGAPFFDDPGEVAPGNDIFIGQPGENDYDAEGGDDIMAQNPAIDRNAGAAGFDWAINQYNTAPANDDLEINQQLAVKALPVQIVVNRDRWQETEADSGSRFNDVISGDDLERVVGPGGFAGCDALDPTGVARIKGLNKLVTQFPSSLADVIDASAMKACPLVGFGGTPADIRSGTVWAEGNIILGGGGSDLLEGRGNNDIIDGDHELTVAISVRNPANPATEIGRTDLMENKATAGSFGPGTAGMTLQQAVFAGLVDPGNLVAVREINGMGATPNNNAASDCSATVAVNAAPGNPALGPGASVNCDTALYSTTADQYTINRNVDGSVTVSFHAPAAAAPAALFGKGDGTDTLWNIENLRFCTGNDALTKACNSFSDIRVSSLPITTPVTANLSPTSLSFGTVPVGTPSATQSVTITNTGTGTLNVNGGFVTGTDPAQVAEFAATNNCTLIVGPGSCTIDVVFTPTTTGVQNAEIDINTNASQLTQVVSLTGGTGVAPPPPPPPPAPTAPGAPTVGTATAGLAGAATVTWTAPATNGGSAITGYTVQVLNAAGVTQVGALRGPAGAGTTSLVVPGLANGVPVTFKVQATNAIGSSAFSGLSNAVTPDATAPTVTARGPAANALVQSQLTNVTATFSEAVQPATLTTATFTLRAGAAAPVAAAVTYNATTRVATLNPTATLAAGTRYTATLSTGVKDLVGNPLATTSWAFSTGPALVLTTHTPATNAINVRRGANVTFTLNRAPVGVNGATVRLVQVSTGAGVGNVLTVTGSTVTFNPGGTTAGLLLPNTLYRLVINAGITDAAGNPLAATSWLFRTGTLL